jgi:tetratricopeptide (TPR) repeat protein
MTNHTEYYEYEDFEIQIKRLGPGYGAVVESSTKGEVWIPLKLPFTRDAMDEILGGFESLVLTSRSRRSHLPDYENIPSSPQQIGQQLFDSLFAGEVLKLYQQRLADVQKEAAKRKGLRIVLNLTVPELARLPWEFLYDTHRQRYLGFRPDTSIVRRVGTELKTPTIDPPLRLLLVSAELPDSGDLAVNDEVKAVQGALLAQTRSGRVQIDVLLGADGRRLREKMRAAEAPHVLHFMGHGGFNQLTLKDKTISGENLAIVLDTTPSLRLVVLNACQAGAAGDSAARLGMAQRLTEKGIPATVAMQFKIYDPAALAFAGEFYRVLAEGWPVDVAVTWGRIAIQDEFGEAWGTPVLYMQARDGRIFRDLLPQSEVAPDEGESEQEETVPLISDVEMAFYYERGLACWDREEWAAALAFFQNAGNHADAPEWVERARQKLQAKEEEERQQVYLATLYAQAQQYRANRQWREVVHLLEQVVKINPTYSGEDGSARNLLERSIEERDRMDRLHQKEQQLQALYEQALRYWEQEQWSRTVRFLEEIERQQPGYRDVPQKLVEARRESQVAELYREGKQHRDQRDWNKAAEAFGKAVAIGPDYKDVYSLWEETRREQRLDALLREGLGYLEQELFGEAIEAFSEIQADDPYRREATVARYYAIGRQAIERERWDEAVQALQQVIAERRDYQGDAQRHYEEARRQLALETEYHKAVTYQKEGQWQDAEAAFRRVEDIQPGYRDVARRLARVREEIHLNDLYQRANRLLNVPDWEEAIQILEEIEQQKPDYEDVDDLLEDARRQRDLDALYNEGLDHYDRGHWQEAEQAFEQIEADASDYRDAAQLLKEARRQLYLEKNYKEGIAYYDQGVKNDNLDQLQLAIQHLQAVLDVQYPFLDAEAKLADAKRQYELLETFNAGRTAFGAGRWEEAIEAWREVVATDSRYQDVTNRLEEAKRQQELEGLYSRADGYANEDQWAEAIAQFEKVLEIDRGYRDAADRLEEAHRQAQLAELYDQGRDCVESGRWDDAICTFEEVLELDPTHQDTSQQLDQARRCRHLQTEYQVGMKAIGQESWGEAIRRLEAVVEAGGYEDAVAQLRRARRQEALRTEYQAGLACIEDEQWDKAIVHFDRVLQMDNKYLDAKAQRQHAQTQKWIAEQYTHALAYIEDEEWLLAEQTLMTLMEKAPDRQEFTQRLEQVRRSSQLKGLYTDASEQLNRGQWKKAIELFEQVLEIAPGDRYHDAEAKLKEAKQAYLGARREEAVKHLEEQSWAEAVAAFDEIWHMQPDYSDVQAQLANALEQHAEALRRAGRRKEATVVLKRLRELQTDD